MNRNFGAALTRLPQAILDDVFVAKGRAPIEVWRSNRFLLQVFLDNAHERLTVCRTELAVNGRYAEGISWDDLQRLKAECGRGDSWAVEVFPPDGDVVNVQNMRHLFVLTEPPAYGWRKGG